MSSGLVETTKEILSNPKVITVVVTSTFYDRWWIEWGSPLFDALASIGGTVLVFAMAYLKIQEILKNRREHQQFLDNKDGDK